MIGKPVIPGGGRDGLGPRYSDADPDRAAHVLVQQPLLRAFPALTILNPVPAPRDEMNLSINPWIYQEDENG